MSAYGDFLRRDAVDVAYTEVIETTVSEPMVFNYTATHAVHEEKKGFMNHLLAKCYKKLPHSIACLLAYKLYKKWINTFIYMLS